MRNHHNLILIAAILVGLACSCPNRLKELTENRDGTASPTPSRSPTTSSTPVSSNAEYTLSMDKYNKIKIGMKRADVENTLGGKGTEISSSVGGGVKFSVNKWEGDNFTSVILTFRNDKVMSKSQVGLK